MSKVKNNSSLPSGKDQRLVTVVREKWAAYQTQEKRFSKDFALALINLHKQLAKPGYGSFVEELKELKIPPSTAYRLMRLHGWKAEKRKKQKPDLPATENDRIAKGQAITKAIGYFQRFKGADLQERFEQFVAELRREVLSEASKEGEAA